MTTYTPSQRKAIARAFKAAKTNLWDGIGERGEAMELICFAINRAADHNEITITSASQSKRIIQQRIKPSPCFGSWIRQQGIHIRDITEIKLQTHRHAWLDMLIEEFSTPEKQKKAKHD